MIFIDPNLQNTINLMISNGLHWKWENSSRKKDLPKFPKFNLGVSNYKEFSDPTLKRKRKTLIFAIFNANNVLSMNISLFDWE